MSIMETPADCQEVQVNVSFAELVFSRILLHCNWIYFNFSYTDLLFFTGHSGTFMVANAKHQQQTMDINYSLFSPF